MKEKKVKISANEINRYTYCPYQWYYGKVYGQKVLKEKYRALDRGEAPYEGNFKKGLHFHDNYYKAYRWKKRIEWAIVIVFVILLGWSITLWL